MGGFWFAVWQFGHEPFEPFLSHFQILQPMSQLSQ